MKRVLYLVSLAALTFSVLLSARVVTASGQRHSSNSTAAKAMTVQLCSSGPYGVPALKDLWQGARNGVDLAIAKYKKKLAGVGVLVGPQIRLDDAKPDGSAYSPDIERSNGLKCIANSNALGYVGPLNTGASVVVEPVLNKAHLVQISPANTGIGLTSVKPWGGYGGRASQEPDTFKHKIPWVTYYRTVTTDNVQGPVGAIYAHSSLHPKTAYIVDDKLPYGAGLALTFTARATALGIKILGHGHIDSSSPAAEAQTAQSLATTIKGKNPDMVYCGCDSETTIALPRDLRSDGYTKPFFGGDAIHNSAWVTDTKSGSVNNYATDVGPYATNTTGAFKSLYRQKFASFYKSPGEQSYDGPAYDAASVILLAIYDAAKAHVLKGSVKNMRTMVVKYIHSMSFCGATGCMHFDKNGDTSNKILTVNHVSGSAWKFVKQIKAPANLPSTPPNTE